MACLYELSEVDPERFGETGDECGDHAAFLPQIRQDQSADTKALIMLLNSVASDYRNILPQCINIVKCLLANKYNCMVHTKYIQGCWKACLGGAATEYIPPSRSKIYAHKEEIEIIFFTPGK